MGACYPKSVINAALAEVGYKEKRTNAKLDSKTENAGSNNWNKYANVLDRLGIYSGGKKNGYAWCDIFVDAMFIFTYGVSDGLRLLRQPSVSLGCSCTMSKSYYVKAKAYGKEPKLGAQIFFKNSTGVVCHTGIVVGYDTKSVRVVEGNSNDSVAQKSYLKSSSKIDGYGYPAFDEEPAVDYTAIARRVISGEFGNGDARRKALAKLGFDYDKVQAEVNRLLRTSAENHL